MYMFTIRVLYCKDKFKEKTDIKCLKKGVGPPSFFQKLIHAGEIPICIKCSSDLRSADSSGDPCKLTRDPLDHPDP